MERWKSDFIALLRAGKDPATAARMCAGLPLAVIQTMREDDPEFGAAWDAVLPEGGDGDSLVGLRVLSPGSLEPLLWAQCTDEEAAAYFGFTEEEFKERVESDPALSKVYALARTGGRAAIKQAQFERAAAGDTTMLTWFGKNHMGQADKIEHKTDKPVSGAPITVTQIFLRQLTTDQLEALQKQGLTAPDVIEGTAERVE